MGVTAVVGAVAGSSLIGGYEQSQAAGKAAKAQGAAAQASIAEQDKMFNTANTNLQPYIQTGDQAANELAKLEGLTGSSNIESTLQSLPGFQFANYQGLKSTQNSATARGLGISGAAQKGAASFSTGLANEYYNNLLSGIQNTENTGAGAAESLGQDATTTGANVGSTITGAGQAKAAGIIGQAAGVANAVNGIPTALITNSLLQQQQSNSQGSIFGNPSNQGQYDPFATATPDEYASNLY